MGCRFKKKSKHSETATLASEFLHPPGRATSGAPKPPRATRNQPESIRTFSKPTFPHIFLRWPCPACPACPKCGLSQLKLNETPAKGDFGTILAQPTEIGLSRLNPNFRKKNELSRLNPNFGNSNFVVKDSWIIKKIIEKIMKIFHRENLRFSWRKLRFS